MTTLDPQGGQDGGASAGEYVLGVLDAQERAAFAAGLIQDAERRREVEAWERHLAPWVDAITPEPAPPALWTRIEAALQASSASPADTNGAVVALRRRVRAWRATAVVGLALAASLAVVAVLPVVYRAPAPAAPAPMMMASLAPAGGKGAMFMATFDPTRGELMIAPAVAQAHPGHAPELWLLPAGGKPVPLGMAGFGAPVRLEMASDVGRVGHTMLAVSLEPVGGSPTGAPTGPVIASGELHPV